MVPGAERVFESLASIAGPYFWNFIEGYMKTKQFKTKLRTLTVAVSVATIGMSSSVVYAVSSGGDFAKFPARIMWKIEGGENIKGSSGEEICQQLFERNREYWQTVLKGDIYNTQVEVKTVPGGLFPSVVTCKWDGKSPSMSMTGEIRYGSALQICPAGYSISSEVWATDEYNQRFFYDPKNKFYCFKPEQAEIPSANLACPCGGDEANQLGNQIKNVMVADPINSATGNSYQLERHIPETLPMGIYWELHYNSLAAAAKWRSSFSRKLAFETQASEDFIERELIIPSEYAIRPIDDKYRVPPFNEPKIFSDYVFSQWLKISTPVDVAYLIGDNGRTSLFVKVDGKWVAKNNGSGLTLTAVTNHPNKSVKWQLNRRNGSTDFFDSAGKLISSTDLVGRKLDLTYDTQNRLAKVQDGYGKTLSLSYSGADSLPSSVVDSRGATIQYRYAAGLVTGVTFADGSTRSFLYEDSRFPTFMTGYIDEEGKRYSTWETDAKGRAIRNSRPHGVDNTTLSYTQNNSTTITDYLGNVVTSQFALRNGVKIRSSQSGMSRASSNKLQTVVYDEAGNPTRTIDFGGKVVDYTYDPVRRLRLTTTEAPGTNLQRVTTTTWHPTLPLPVKDVTGGVTTVYEYDAKGLLQARTEQTASDSRVWRYQYSAFGLIAKIESPDGSTSIFEYDKKNGNLLAKTQAGLRTTYAEHDAWGRARRINYPDGRVEKLTYDARGRLITRQVGSETTRYSYLRYGLPQQIIMADGSWIRYQYDDARRLTEISDSTGRKIQYAYRVVAENKTLERTTTATDPNGQLASASAVALEALPSDVNE